MAADSRCDLAWGMSFMTEQVGDIQRPVVSSVEPHRTADPRALAVADLARLLSVAEEKIREHVAAGAPTAADGMINLVHYAAWLNQRLKERDGD